jgi:HSP20 family protein
MFRRIPFNFKNNAEKGRETVEKLLDSVLVQSLKEPVQRMNGVIAPFRVDVIDADDHYELEAELPGFNKAEVSISYAQDKYLTIRAERLNPEEEPCYIYHERRNGVYERSFQVDDIDWDNTSASLQAGVLHIILPKSSEGKNKKFIDIA